MAACSIWTATFLLPSIYADACNEINSVLYERFIEKIAISPKIPVGKGYEAFAWRIHIKDIHNL
jgi:hypothetical protein